MNTTFHIIRKDLRFNRWALLLWAANIYVRHYDIAPVEWALPPRAALGGMQ